MWYNLFKEIKFLIKRPSLKEQAQRKIAELEQYCFDAKLAKIQYENAIVSYQEQIKLLEQFK